MFRRFTLIAVLGTLLVLTAACTNKKAVNPLAGVGSKQPDKVLFDKAMEREHIQFGDGIQRIPVHVVNRLVLTYQPGTESLNELQRQYGTVRPNLLLRHHGGRFVRGRERLLKQSAGFGSDAVALSKRFCGGRDVAPSTLPGCN